MEKVVTIHRSHKEAEEADNAYYRSLTPDQRLDILLELTKPDETQPRLERVVKIFSGSTRIEGTRPRRPRNPQRKALHQPHSMYRNT
jgi:hypothetical protein